MISLIGAIFVTVAIAPTTLGAIGPGTVWRSACLSAIFRDLSTPGTRYEAGYPLEAHVLSVNLPDRSAKSRASFRDAIAETLSARWVQREEKSKDTGDKTIVWRLEPDLKKRLPGNSDEMLNKVADLVKKRLAEMDKLLDAPPDQMSEEDRFEVTKGRIKAQKGVLDGIPGAIQRLDKNPWIDGSKRVVTLTGGEIAGIAPAIKDLAQFWHPGGQLGDLNGKVTLELVGSTLQLRVGDAEGLMLAWGPMEGNGKDGMVDQMNRDRLARQIECNRYWLVVPNIEFVQQVADLFDKAVENSMPALVDWYDLTGSERFDNQLTYQFQAEIGRVYGDMSLLRRDVSGIACYRPDQWLDLEVYLMPSDLRTKLEHKQSYSLEDLVDLAKQIEKGVIAENRELSMFVGLGAGLWLCQDEVREMLKLLIKEDVDWSKPLPDAGIVKTYGKLGAIKVENDGDFRSYTVEARPERSDKYSCHFLAKWKPK